MRFLPKLFENNRAWARERESGDPGFFRRLADQQSPDYLWIGCADSRVPANEIVGLDPGELFVHRNVANLVEDDDPNARAVIDFAVEVLGVEHVIVCGHYGCGGVRLALDGGDATGVPASVVRWIEPLRSLRHRHETELAAIDDPDRRWRRLCELNVIDQVAAVARTQAVQRAWAEGRSLVVHGWIYDVRDGLLQDLDVSVSGKGG